MKWEKTVYVDEDGVCYTKEELEKIHYKTIKTITKANFNYEKNERIISTTKRIKTYGRKPEQLRLF